MKKLILIFVVALISSNLVKAQNLNATISSSTNVSCFGGNNGSATVITSGGTSPYTFMWNTAPQQTTATAINLAAGSYTVTVTDAVSNTTTVNVIISQPAQITVNAGTDMSICHNGTATLNGSVTVATSVAWTTSGTGSFSPDSTALNAVYSPSAGDNSSGTVTLTLTSTGNGTCAAASDAMVLTLIPLPTITATIPGSRCGVGSVTLGATASAGNIMWYYAMTGGTSIGIGGSYTTNALSSTTTFYVDATFSGCTSTSRTPVVATINYLPVATATPASQTICSGSSTNISLSSSAGGTTFSWTVVQNGISGASNSSGSNISQTLIATGVSTGMSVYTITPIAAGCVGNNLDVTVNVFPIPNVVTNPASQTICSGTSTGISLSSAVSGTTFSWTVTQNGINGTTASNGNAISQTLSNSGTTAGTATYTITPNANSCVGSPVDAVITVNTLPIITSATKTDVTICGGIDGTITVVATGDAPLTYSIDGGAVFAANGGYFTGLPAGTYSIAVKNVNGCYISYGTFLTINEGSAPPPPAAGTNATYCQGQSLSNLSATAGYGGTITWYSTAALINVIDTGVSLTPFSTVGTQDYYITETVSGCESQSTVVTVTVNPLPLVSAGTDQNICYGTSTTLTGNGSGTGTTYSWYPTTGLSSSVIANPVATPVETTIYTLVVADANGCTDSDTVVVSVNSLPVVTLSNFPSLCINAGTIVLTGGLPTGGIYSGVGISGNSFDPIATGVGSHIITYIYTDINSCTNSDTATIIVNSLPTVTFSGLATEFCRADTMVLLIGNYSTTGMFSGTGIIGSNVFNPLNANAGSIQITYSYTDINGCTNSYIASTIINENPVLSATTSNATCNQNNGSAILSATGGTAPYLYSTGSNTMNNLSAGAYTIGVTDYNGCKSTSPVLIVNDGAPVISILSQVDAGCSISCDGAAAIDITGGAEPYTIIWSDGSALQNPVDLCVGENYVQVTDFNNCITGAVVNIGFTQPDPTIFGMISYSGGFIDGQFANLEIYSISQNFGGGFDLMNSQVQIGSDGSFVMANFPPDMYILKVLLQGNNPAYSNLINSYYTNTGTAYTWETADTIILNCGEYKEANIVMHEMYQAGTGSGLVSGTISYPGTTGGSKNLNKGISISQGKLAGEPVPGAEIFIELEPDDEPILNTTTDTAGFYAFEELPEGGYSLRVEIPGFPMLSTYTVTVSATDSVFEGLNFFVDTTVNDGNIDTSLVFIANEDAPILSVSVYPNPYTDFVTVAYKINKTREISINVIDVTGKIIAFEKPEKKVKGEYSYNLNSVNNLKSGIYFIQIKVDNNIYLKKVIKTK